jgi:hypothetical protein
MKVRVGYTTYIETDVEIDDKFSVLEEDETEADWEERDKLCDEMLGILRNTVGEIHIDSVVTLDEDGEEINCIFEM